MDIHQSSLWAKYMEALGWQTVDLKPGYAYIRKLPLLGSIVKIPKASSEIDLVLVNEVSEKNKAIFTKIEPVGEVGDQKLSNSLVKAGFEADNWSLQPTKTLVVDLKAPEEEILTRMEKDTRYSIRSAEKKGVRVEKADDFETFWSLHSQTAKRGKFWTIRADVEKLWKVFSEAKQGLILVASFNEQPLATSMVLFQNKKAYYYHAGSSTQRRDLFAPYLVVWESIKEAKKKGCTSLDLMGIVDPRIKATRSWAGFSHFKKGFGGEEKTYLGSYAKFYNPIFKLIFKLNKFF
ncbi:MAG: peptidoglycan bridge formation glycyltransferase FemA/FemB family protein [bacterium]|nr:peptidoglycan bridge formation glycyltransferase FemA/FemB family protein [bacterium]